jgi:hypothetical protein
VIAKGKLRQGPGLYYAMLFIAAHEDDGGINPARLFSAICLKSVEQPSDARTTAVVSLTIC